MVASGEIFKHILPECNLAMPGANIQNLFACFVSDEIKIGALPSLQSVCFVLHCLSVPQLHMGGLHLAEGGGIRCYV